MVMTQYDAILDPVMMTHYDATSALTPDGGLINGVRR